MKKIFLVVMMLMIATPGPGAWADEHEKGESAGDDSPIGIHRHSSDGHSTGTTAVQGLHRTASEPAAPDPQVPTRTADRQKESLPGTVKNATPPDPNRRWIMRQKDYRNQKITPKPAAPLEWKDTAQRKRCRQEGQELSQAFDKARYYSIQGDRCRTARYAAIFLKHARKSRDECPATFLERQGFNDLIIRNMNQLKALGTESCLGTPGPPAAKAPHPKPSAPELEK